MGAFHKCTPTDVFDDCYITGSHLVCLFCKLHCCCAAAFAVLLSVPGRRLWLMSFHNFISTYYAPLLFRPLSFVRGLRALFGEAGCFGGKAAANTTAWHSSERSYWQLPAAIICTCRKHTHIAVSPAECGGVCSGQLLVHTLSLGA